LNFSAGEFLLADAGYTNSAVSCVPYKNPEAQLPDNELFNHLFSQARCMIEHVNGILKSRFMSLKNLRIKVHKKEDFAHVNEWILCCCILYNMCKVQVDEWPDAVENEEEDLQYVLHLQNMHANEGIRDRVQAVLLQWYHATQPV
jgi:DDE superfamily endonuclease